MKRAQHSWMDGFDYRGTKIMFGGMATAIATTFGAIWFDSKWLFALAFVSFAIGFAGAVMHQRAFNRFVRRDRRPDDSSR